jgi:hypothetical protein
MKLVKPHEVEVFREILKKHGWRVEDFEVQEEVLDPSDAEVEAELGEVTVDCLRTHKAERYPIGRGGDWVTDFADDLEFGKFGKLPEVG